MLSTCIPSFFLSDWLLNLERDKVDGQILRYLCS
jgi:hypothetical protein